MTAILVGSFRTQVGKMGFEAAVTRSVKRALSEYPDAYLADIRFDQKGKASAMIVRVVVRAPRELGAEDVGKLEDSLPRPADGNHLEPRLRQLQTTVMTRNGPLFSVEDTQTDR